MSRRIGPVCRLCRREGMKLFLKGTRCETPKCAVERRDSPPGMHVRRGKLTDYAVHLREKQKVKHFYGVLEKQFRIYFKKAERSKANTGDALMQLLERRLDNVVHRMGIGLSRRQARQMISHGHITVNDRRTDVASYLVKVNDVIRIKNKKRTVRFAVNNLEVIGPPVPGYLAFSKEPFPEGRVLRYPQAEDFAITPNLQLIIELCSK